MSITLYGKPVADNIKADVAERAEKLRAEGIIPRLAILRAGERPDDLSYEKRVLKMCEAVGIETSVSVLPADTSHEEIKKTLTGLNDDPAVHGILVFRPLPSQVDEADICDTILAEKDIDCMNPENLKKVFTGDRTAIPPCTPEAVIEILKHYDTPLQGSSVVIVNRSLVLGKPLSMLFLDENATVTICHSRTKDLAAITGNADIVVTGIGRPEFFDRSYFSRKNTVVDVGINFADGRMCGDVKFDEVSETAAAITPVPGGVGAVTSAILLRHLVEAAEHSKS